MRTEIKRVQRKLRTSTIFVTHDQEEALSLGDKIAVMNDGVVQQVGTPQEIYHEVVVDFTGAGRHQDFLSVLWFECFAFDSIFCESI